MLSFDVEEFFQVQAAALGGLRPEDWDRYDLRLAPCVDHILELLAAHNAGATFFVLGWVARREPEVVRKIAAAGYEIASHGMDHRMVHLLSKDDFRADIRQSKSLLEDLSGRAVLGYRAPTFSITRRTAWALDVLAEEGFGYDSSIFPIRHDRYGVPDAPCRPFRAKGPGGAEILEIPPLTLRVLGMNMPVGGGGYLRLLPSHVLAHAIRKAQWQNQPGMIYLHPWEFDPGQAILPMSRVSRFRHRVNLARTSAKLTRLLSRFDFGSVESCLESLRAAPATTFSL